MPINLEGPAKCIGQIKQVFCVECEHFMHARYEVGYFFCAGRRFNLMIDAASVARICSEFVAVVGGVAVGEIRRAPRTAKNPTHN